MNLTVTQSTAQRNLRLHQNPATVCAETCSGGVFRSASSGGAWTAANADLGNPLVGALAPDLTAVTTVYADPPRRTYGGSVWQLTRPATESTSRPIPPTQ